MSRVLIVAGALVVGLIGVLAGTLPFLPAAYLAQAVESASTGRVLLAEPEGTVWSGRGRPAFVSSGKTEAARSAALPALAWRVDEFGIAPPRLGFTVAGEGLVGQPFRVRWKAGQVTVEPGEIHGPARVLEAVGAPFNTLRPGGDVTLAWDTLSVDRGAAGYTGTLTVEWREASSALSSVAPLGSYRFTARGINGAVAIELATTSGPLLLSGAGQWSAARGLQFQGEASADPARRDELRPLIGLLGRASPNGAELRFGS